MSWLLVILGGAAGAVLRHLTDQALRARLGTAFPWGTLAVNLAGCALVGLLTGVATNVHLLLATGLCGALTTYSAFSWDTLTLASHGRRARAAAYVAASVLAGLAATAAGAALARAAWG
ncbi:fluoride efflux transporter CrcB [Streptomyces sp. DSM 44917]|uniref:Fluoride-specific ion channel FluC n=1 Tax=Streptomyces boetiae TaxID=3075541 RepID=A0ABU2L792_9ACTN|nr:fluoride efflux transporter CrcB [Streptomyces sp. DSM 44917]MDT0307431.1 fluoride efflux transporter CrcB [Streptomyces sp. DSM 44917]